MTSVMKVLRDPVWQSIGVLIAILALFISTSKVTKDVELSIVHWNNMDFDTYWLPPDGINLQFKNKKEDINKIGIDHFLLINSSSKPILPSDYISQLSVKKINGNGLLYVVESCSQKMEQQCSSAGLVGGGGAYVPFSWAGSGDKWSAKPELLNAGDQSCVLLISEKDGSEQKPIKSRFQWNGRLVNVRLKNYESPEEYYKSREKNIGDYFFASVIIQGRGIYWFLFLQCVFISVFIYFGSRSQWLPSLEKSHIIKIWFIALLSITSSEILIDIFINRRSGLHPIIWPLLLAHFALCIFLIRRIFRQLLRGRG